MMSRQRTMAVAVFALALAAGWSARAEAAEATESGAQTTGAVCPICHRATDGSTAYSEKAGKTLTRGAMNTALGWTELISEPVHEAKSGGNVFMGIGKGIGKGVQRTVAGLGEVLTFWTPKMNNQYVHFATDCPICMKSGESQKP